MGNLEREFLSLDGQADRYVRDRADELLVNGQSITHQVDGYRQMTVDRQDLEPWDVETEQYLARSGERVVSTRKTPRDFVIKYKLRGESSEDLRYKYRQLAVILNNIDEIEFLDEPDYFYRDVWLVGSSRSEETSNTVISTYTLRAHDPYRYEKNTTTSDIVRIDADYVPVEEIKITFAETLERPEIRIQNGLYETGFRLLGTVEEGAVVTVRVNQSNGRVTTVGGAVELGTIPREFILYDGARGNVVGSYQSTVEFTYRGRVL